jgi:AcrR family transcriptional regulator
MTVLVRNPTNRHELRRRSTHEALRQAALKSFACKGFANVTVTELAREAGVTERTFFRHFPTKEAALSQDYETQLERLAEALARRPAIWPPRSRAPYSRRPLSWQLRIGAEMVVSATSVRS